MNDFNYKELLKHPKWQKKRLEILERDDFQCQLCDDTETTLHIHHLEYEYGNKPWEYEDDVLLTVCKDCHEIVEHFKDIDDPIEISNSQISKHVFHTIETDYSTTKILFISDHNNYLRISMKKGEILDGVYMVGGNGTQIIANFLNKMVQSNEENE